MKTRLQHPLRVTRKLLWLGAELALAAMNLVRFCVFRPEETLPTSRAAWLQHTARRMLRVLGVVSRVSGGIPSSGLLVSNHLGYLDILVLAANMRAVFVSKSEVKSWPVFGWFARRAGTIFVQRDKTTHVGRLTNAIEAALHSGVAVILFPEGTSSGGQTVLPFKSSLLEPAARQKHPLTAGVIHYELPDGDVSEEVCYWKDMTLLPHLLNLLSKREVRASVRFTELQQGSTNRKELARQLHSEVLRLKAALACPT